uniref:Uncharacterized protein n=1 Tax=Steinernema glaseri TaxID=37863 RepID=A0A1I8AKK1_9BILA
MKLRFPYKLEGSKAQEGGRGPATLLQRTAELEKRSGRRLQRRKIKISRRDDIKHIWQEPSLGGRRRRTRLAIQSPAVRP